jgi:hypothetical protein
VLGAVFVQRESIDVHASSNVVRAPFTLIILPAILVGTGAIKNILTVELDAMLQVDNNKIIR